MRFSLNIGTRGRPEPLKKTLEHTLLHLARDDSRILVSIDDDDKETISAIPTFPTDDRLIVSVKPREDNRGEKSDRVLTEAPADIYMIGHDCVPILTPGFDQIIVNAAKLFPDGIGMVCSGMANASFPAMQAVTKRWVELVGYIYNHEYPFWFIDHELDDLAKMTGRVVYVSIDTPVQLHPGKTNRMRDLTFWCNYFDMNMYRRQDIADRIIDAMECPEWQKHMLRTWHVPVEARTIWINKEVRDNADRIEADRADGSEPDAGYLRSFEQARQTIKVLRREIQQSHREAA